MIHLSFSTLVAERKVETRETRQRFPVDTQTIGYVP